MKRILTATLGLVVMTTAPTLAADLPMKAAPAPVAPVMNWTGAYIGGNVGYSWGRSDNDIGLWAPAVPVRDFYRFFGTRRPRQYESRWVHWWRSGRLQLAGSELDIRYGVPLPSLRSAREYAILRSWRNYLRGCRA